jgi:hypothetical protein
MLWIRSRIDLALLDPNPHWEQDADPGARKFTKIIKKTLTSAFQKDFCTYVGQFYDL